jgi:hypothetical protein
MDEQHGLPVPIAPVPIAPEPVSHPELPPQSDIDEFKTKVKRWLTIDEEIADYEKKIKDLKQLKNKQLEPQITGFMREYNIKDLNTENGKIRCNERKVKRPLNRNNIQDNLTKVIHDELMLEQAMNLIMNNREIKVTYKLTKPKK